MKKTLYTLLLVAISMAFLASCSESTTPTTTTYMTDYYPMQVGNYWKYNVDSTDSQYNTIRTKNISITKINQMMTYMNKSCYQFFENSDTTYQYVSGNSAYTFTAGFSFDDEKSNAGQWIEIYNLSKQVTVVNIDTTFDVMGFSMQIKATGTSKPSTTKGSFIYKGVTYETFDFDLTMDMSMQVVGMPETKTTSAMTGKNSMVKGIGLVKVIGKTVETNPENGTTTSYEKQTLTETNVK